MINMTTLHFNTAAGGVNESRKTKCRKRRSSEWPYPIGRASMGRLCDIIVELLALVSPELYRATHMALYAYIKNPGYVPSEPVDEDVYLRGCEEIDRSMRRSRLARERAAARKKAVMADELHKPDKANGPDMNGAAVGNVPAEGDITASESVPAEVDNTMIEDKPEQTQTIPEKAERTEPVNAKPTTTPPERVPDTGWLGDWPRRRRPRYPFEADCY